MSTLCEDKTLAHHRPRARTEEGHFPSPTPRQPTIGSHARREQGHEHLQSGQQDHEHRQSGQQNNEYR